MEVAVNVDYNSHGYCCLGCAHSDREQSEEHSLKNLGMKRVPVRIKEASYRKLAQLAAAAKAP